MTLKNPAFIAWPGFCLFCYLLDAAALIPPAPWTAAHPHPPDPVPDIRVHFHPECPWTDRSASTDALNDNRPRNAR